MGRCETCGNDYDKSFQMIMNGETHTYDSFECAIEALGAALCELRHPHHRSRTGSGQASIFCCDHCAERMGVIGPRRSRVERRWTKQSVR